MFTKLRALSAALGLALVAFGAFGMLICSVLAWSTDVRDVLGAALGFVAGSILLGAGSVTLAICSSSAGAQPSAGTSGPSA